MAKEIKKTYEQVVSEVFLKHKEHLLDIAKKEKDIHIDQASNNNDRLNTLSEMEKEIRILWQ